MRLEPVNSQSLKYGYLLKTSNASQLLPTLRILFHNLPFPLVHVLSNENKCSYWPKQNAVRRVNLPPEVQYGPSKSHMNDFGFSTVLNYPRHRSLMGTDNRVLTTLHAIKFKIFVQQLYGFIKPNGAVRIPCVLISTTQEGEKLAYRNIVPQTDH